MVIATVRGVEGFRIPTLSLSLHKRRPGLQATTASPYRDYVRAVAQHVAVDTEAAAAIALLAQDPSLVSAWVMQVVKPFVSASTGLWSRVSTISFMPSWLIGVASLESLMEVQHPLRADPFRVRLSPQQRSIQILSCTGHGCKAASANSLPADRFTSNSRRPSDLEDC